MGVVLLDQVKAMLQSVLGITNRNVAKAQEDAAKALEDATTAKTAVAGKMDANNPVATGSFSMGRSIRNEIGEGSHAAGFQTTASGGYSHAEGGNTTASGGYSHAEGGNTTASGYESHAEGVLTVAQGRASHAEGNSTKAYGDDSHAEGWKSVARASYSHAEGQSTTADGPNSHAEGLYSVSFSTSSHAEGLYTNAHGENQHVQGRYNVIDYHDRYAHIVGNGFYDVDKGREARSNAHTLDWDGNAWFAGDVYVGGSSQDEGEKLVRKSELDEAVSGAGGGDGTVYVDAEYDYSEVQTSATNAEIYAAVKAGKNVVCRLRCIGYDDAFVLLPLAYCESDLCSFSVQYMTPAGLGGTMLDEAYLYCQYGTWNIEKRTKA
ncbi:MAG: hypothetical protein IKY42_01010 [Bacteroidaceae bacterium]|nr:hypothetical protein [Bacteroidaceae bacterium]